jgi:MFS family permease
MVTFLGAHVVNDFYSTVIPPFLPVLAEDFGLEYTELGILAGAFGLLTGVLQPVMGHRADQRGQRRFILTLGFAMAAIGFLAMASAPSFWIIVGVSLLCGLGGATYHPQATAYIVQAYPNDRGRMLGLHGWGGSVGHFLAPAAAAASAAWFGWRITMVAIAVPLLITSFVVRSRLEETTPNESASLLGALTPRLIKTAIGFGLMGIVLSSFTTFFVQMLVDEGWSTARGGAILSVILVVGVVAQPVGGRLFDLYGGRVVYGGAVVGSALSVIVFSTTSGAVSLIAVGGVAFFGFAMFPVGLALASQLATDGQTGAAVGFSFGLSSLMATVTKPLFGALAQSMGDIRSALPWTLVVLAVALVMATRFDSGHVTANKIV